VSPVLRRDVLPSPVRFYKLSLPCHPTGYWMLDDIIHYHNANSNSRRIFANFGNMIRFEFEFAKANSNFYVGIRIRIRRIFPSFSKFGLAEYPRIRIRIRIWRIFPHPCRPAVVVVEEIVGDVEETGGAGSRNRTKTRL
jgi:hypothetical protein